MAGPTPEEIQKRAETLAAAQQAKDAQTAREVAEAIKQAKAK